MSIAENTYSFQCFFYNVILQILLYVNYKEKRKYKF